MKYLLELIVIFSLYFLPSTIAFKKKLVNKNTIKLTNIFFGWTILGWIFCLFLVYSKKKIDNKIIEGIQVILLGLAAGLLAYFFDFTNESEDSFLYIFGSVFILIGLIRIVRSSSNRNTESQLNYFESQNINYNLPEKLTKLNELYKNDAITEDEYLNLKHKLLNS